MIIDDGKIEEINNIVISIGIQYHGMGVAMKTGEVYPANIAPAVSIENSRLLLSLMKWGFPHKDGKGVIVNAKSETAAKKRLFASPLARRRCVIPSTGFFEWIQSKGKPKAKYLFNTDEGPMLYMAGLYTEYPSPAKDFAVTARFVILTREANDTISDANSRMPVILYKHEIPRWLTDYRFAESVMRRDTIRLNRTAALRLIADTKDWQAG